jgi:hypothetical protein
LCSRRGGAPQASAPDELKSGNPVAHAASF